MKKLLLSFLCMLFAFSSAIATTIDGVEYDIFSDEAKVISLVNKNITTLEIPSKVSFEGKEYPVVSINSDVFRDCTSLISIKIPNSVNYIGTYAFSGCTGLTSIEIPNSITKLNNSVFRGCTNLVSVKIPNSVKSIEHYAFADCSSLKEVHITDFEAWFNIDFKNYDSNPLCYGGSLYLNGEKITSVVIPNSVSSLKGTFCGYKDLTSVEIPNSVQSIGDNTFRGCSGLTSINIPNSVQSIGKYSFSFCYGLNSIQIPYSVSEIGGAAFYECTSLTYVKIPESVTSLASNTFYGCTSLTTVDLPSKITKIGVDGSGAFTDCSNLSRMICRNPYAPEIFYTYTNEFENVDLYVPQNGYGSYRSKYQEKFKSINPLKSIIILTPATYDMELFPAKENQLALSLDDATDFTALQFDVEVPEGVVIPEGGVVLNKACVDDHKMQMNKLSSVANTYRIVLTSASAKAFKAGDALFKFTFKADASFRGGEIRFSNVIGTETIAHTDVKSYGTTVTIPAMELVESVVITGDESVNVERTIELGTTINPSNAGYTAINWKSSDESVATVDANGTVTGVSKGTATITASVSSYGTVVEGTKVITVTNFVREITLSDNEVTLERAKTHQFTATVTPADADEATIEWSTSDTGIATIDANGLLTALMPGTVTVTASNAALGVSATAEVTVKEYLYGDANDDGVVTLADVNAVIAYILEKNPQPFSVAKADMNQNNMITVSDVTLITDDLLDQPSGASLAAPLRGNVSGELHLGSEGYYMLVSANADASVNALQADIELPAGFTVGDITPLGAGAADGSVAVREIDGSTCRFILYSTNLSEFGADGAPLLRIDLRADDLNTTGTVKLTGVNANSMVDGDYSMEEMSMEVGQLSAIHDVMSDEISAEAEFYTLDGVKLQERPAAPGVYIVREGGKTYKQLIK